MNKSNRGTIKGAFLKYILFLVFFFIGCIEKHEDPIRLGLIASWPGYEPYYFAREKGYFPEADVKLLDYNSQTAQMRAFQNGAIDVAAFTLDMVFKLKNSGVDLKIVQLIDISKGADCILSRPEFKTFQELKNKRIGVETTALGDYMLTRGLESAGMKLSDIQVVPLEFMEHERAFKEGRIEALVTFEPLRTKLLKAGAQNLFDSSHIPGEIADVLAVRTVFLQKGEKKLTALLHGWFKAVEDIKKDKNVFIRFMAERAQLNEKDMSILLDGLQFSDLADNRKNLTGASPELFVFMERNEKMLRERNLINADVDCAELIDGSYITRMTK